MAGHLGPLERVTSCPAELRGAQGWELDLWGPFLALCFALSPSSSVSSLAESLLNVCLGLWAALYQGAGQLSGLVSHHD